MPAIDHLDLVWGPSLRATVGLREARSDQVHDRYATLAALRLRAPGAGTRSGVRPPTGGDAHMDADREIRDEIAEQDPAVGGRVDPHADDATRPLEEAGQGYAEGFEQAEDDLIEAASHGDEAGDPVGERGRAEPESARAGAEYAEPDEMDVTEVTHDPAEGRDAPGAGPGIAADR